MWASKKKTKSLIKGRKPEYHQTLIATLYGRRQQISIRYSKKGGEPKILYSASLTFKCKGHKQTGINWYGRAKGMLFLVVF